MTIAELIEQLQKMPQSAPVWMTDDLGNRAETDSVQWEGNHAEILCNLDLSNLEDLESESDV